MMESGADPATMTLGEMLSANGLDVNGPALPQISKFTDGILGRQRSRCRRWTR